MKYLGGGLYSMIEIWHHNATGLWLFTTPVFIYAELHVVPRNTCTSLNVFSVSEFFPETNCTCIGKALLRRRKKKYSSRGYIILKPFWKEQFLLRTKLHWTQKEGNAVDTKSFNIHLVKIDWFRVVK